MMEKERDLLQEENSTLEWIADQKEENESSNEWENHKIQSNSERIAELDYEEEGL